MSPAASVSIPRRAMAVMGAFYFFYFALVGIYIIYLPQMLKQSGFSATQVGILYAAAPLMRFVLPFVFRRYVALDERIYRLALSVMVGAGVLFWVSAGSFGLYLGVNLLYGAAMGAILPYVDAIALGVITREHYGKVRLWGSIGFIAIALWLGQMLGGLEETFGYLIAASGLTAATGLLIVRYDPHRDVPIDRDEERAFSLTRYWAFWGSALLLQVSFGGFYNFFTIYETAHGFSQETISYLWSFGVLIEIAMLYFQGPLMRYDLLHLIGWTTLTAVARWLLLWRWPDSVAVAYLSQSLHAFNFALYYTATIAYVYTLYTQKKLAQQFYLGITFGLGGSIGAALSGWIYDRYPEELFGFGAVVALGAWGMIGLHAYRQRRDDAVG